MTAFLTIDGVRRSFGDVTALDGVSLDVREGEFFALLGPSGCGKTTLLRILAGFETPDGGSVTLDGDDLVRIPAHKRPVNLMFQSYALFPHLSVAGNIAYGLHRERLPRLPKSEIKQRVDEVLGRVGLSSAAARRPHQLSGGQRQRVALARAIVKRPRLLLLDEPLSALDRKVRAEMQLWLKQLQHEVGITFVVVTHDQEEALSMADRIAVLNRGTVEQVADAVTLYGSPRTHFVADFIGANNFFSGTATAAGLETPDFGLLPARPGDLLPGAEAVLAVRPEEITLTAAPPAGTPSASAPGTPSASAPGTPSASAPGTPSGSAPGSPSGSAPGSPSGSAPGSPSGSAPGSLSTPLPTSASGPHPALLSGDVVDVSFYGGMSRVAVRIAAREAPLLVHQQGAPTVAPGERVAVSWTSAVLVPATPASGAAVPAPASGVAVSAPASGVAVPAPEGGAAVPAPESGVAGAPTPGSGSAKPASGPAGPA